MIDDAAARAEGVENGAESGGQLTLFEPKRVLEQEAARAPKLLCRAPDEVVGVAGARRVAEVNEQALARDLGGVGRPGLQRNEVTAIQAASSSSVRRTSARTMPTL